MTQVGPFDLMEARQAARLASRRQEAAEDQVRHTSRDLADKERIYRMALATRITELHAGGVAWTTCETMAKGDEKVARLRYERDVARGVLEAAQQSMWRHTADRRDVGRFIEWSARREMSGSEPEPQGKLQTFGGRRAA